MTIEPEAFLARYLAHIPVPGLQALRGYGLYATHARAALGQPPLEDPNPLSAAHFLARFRHTPDASSKPQAPR